MRRTVTGIATLLLAVSAFADERPELEFTRWSGKVNVPDPVAISLDHHGRAYVTQTRRRKSQDLDIRANRDWIPLDVGFRSVAEKRAFYHERLAPDRDDPSKAKRVADLNGDGSHDWRDLTVLDERIHVVTDTDGDGTADAIHLFADDFRTEVTGIAAGVLWTPGRADSPHGDVYATIAPDVWRLRDTDGDGRADEREAIAHGFGLHIAYAGHDMHGLTVGPDGRLYWTVGDKGISVVSKEGREFRYPNEGGVLRCDPDGSNFEVFARGLRNVQELAFDEHGNLFGVDNDADMPGERERFVYIVQGMDAGWRCHYQYRGDAYNPWTAEKLWVPHHEGQAAYITPPIAHSIDGPAGFTRDPGTALGPAYRGYFFLTGAPGGKQIAFKVKPDGASFAMDDVHEIGNGIPLVGINFGPDGALYGVDWGGGYPLNQNGAIWKIDLPGHSDRAERTETARLLREGVDESTEHDELIGRLNHADQRVRLAAQFELVRRGTVDGLVETSKRAPQRARIHAIWGLGQLVRSGRAKAEPLTALLGDDDAEIRAQAARTLQDAPEFDGRPFVALLADENPRVRFHAAIALGTHPTPDARPAIVKLLAENAGRDLYLRHAGIVALASCGGAADLADHESEAVRIAAVVALRRNADSAVARFLADESPLVVAEAARAIHDDNSITLAMLALAALLDDPPTVDEVTIRRAINAAFRMGGLRDAERIATYAANERAPTALRLDALDALRRWTDPPVLDRVDGHNRHETYTERALPADRLSPHLTAPLRSDDAKVRTAALATARTIGVAVGDDVLAALVANEQRADALRIEALAVLAAQKSERLRAAIDAANRSKSPAVRIAGLHQLAKLGRAERRAIEIVNESDHLGERQAAIAVLGSLDTPGSGTAMDVLFGLLRKGDVDPAIALDVLEATRERSKQPDGQVLTRDLKRYEDARTEAAKDDPLAPFTECYEGGDATRGRAIFATNVTAQCIRCHRIGKEGSNVGPALDGIATKRKPDHLLRAIVAPSADIDAKYRTRVLLLASGKSVQGVLREKNDDETVLVDAKGKEVRIANDDIDDEVEQNVSIMPDLVKQLSCREIRDLMAYLGTLQEE